jgi:hypothetical protein
MYIHKQHFRQHLKSEFMTFLSIFNYVPMLKLYLHDFINTYIQVENAINVIKRA